MKLLKTNKTTNIKWPHTVVFQRMEAKSIELLYHILPMPSLWPLCRKISSIKKRKLDPALTLTIYHTPISFNAKFLKEESRCLIPPSFHSLSAPAPSPSMSHEDHSPTAFVPWLCMSPRLPHWQAAWLQSVWRMWTSMVAAPCEQKFNCACSVHLSLLHPYLLLSEWYERERLLFTLSPRMRRCLEPRKAL